MNSTNVNDPLPREYIVSKLLPEMRIEHRARIRFTYDHMNAGYARLVKTNTSQVLWNDATEEHASLNPVHERATTWTLADGTAILEIVTRGAAIEPAVLQRLSLMVPAHVRFHEEAGEKPSLVHAGNFPETDSN